MKLKKEFFVNILLINKEDRLNKCLNALKENGIVDESELNVNEELILKLNNLIKIFGDRWISSSRSRNNFVYKHNEWIQGEFNYEFKSKNSNYSKTTNGKTTGRPMKDFNDSLPNTKRIKISNHSKTVDNNVELGLMSTKLSAKRQGNKVIEKIMNEIIKNQQNVHLKLFSKNVGVSKLSGLEALAFLLDSNLTKDQYIKVRLQTLRSGADIYPAYDEVRQAKHEIRPEGVVIEETKAFVSYQNLINITTQRLIKLTENIVMELLSKKPDIQLTLIFNTGFDGSSGYSKYHQKFKDEDSCDDSLIVTVLIPLQLIDDSNEILWINQSPHSIKFVRPIMMEFGKETKEKIMQMKDDIDHQVENLESVTVVLPNFKAVNVFPKVLQTAYDGKVRAVITGKKT